MSTDQGPVVQSALLRSELVRLRKEKGLTQEQVARTLEWSPSKLIRIEGGRSSITRTDLQALLQQYNVTSESRQERLQALARGAREPAWWNTYRGELPDVVLNFVGYAAGASYIRHFHGALVPGLLQTEQYARALAVSPGGRGEANPSVRLRMQRQREMAKREVPPRQYYVLDEAVIRRHIGISIDPAIMPNQLRALQTLIEEDELVTIRVIPFNVGAHRGLDGPFTLLEFEGGLSDALYLEGGTAPSVMATGDDPRITEYQDIFESLLDEALSVDDSLDLIKRTAEELMA